MDVLIRQYLYASTRSLRFASSIDRLDRCESTLKNIFRTNNRQRRHGLLDVDKYMHLGFKIIYIQPLGFGPVELDRIFSVPKAHS